MGNFYTRLSYSFGNEDWKTEQQALQIKPTHRVLCVTASGDRPLNLLSVPCKEIVTIDANPIQNALFDLKVAALKSFDYDEYLAFLGLNPMKKRLNHYDKIRKHLSHSSDQLWQQHRSKIQKGVLFEGAIEKMAKFTSTIARTCRKKKIEKLFSFDDLNEQIAFVKKEFDTRSWQAIFTFVHPFRRFLKDPGLYEYVDSNIHVGKFLHFRINRYLNQALAKESVLMSLILKGNLDRKHLPPYLSEKYVPIIKKQLDRICFETIDLISYLERAPDNSFDCFSMSDVASYIPKAVFERMVTSLVRVAKPGSRFCIRQFLTNYTIPKHLEKFFKRDKKLETKLEHEDNCLVYHFIVGEVVK